MSLTKLQKLELKKIDAGYKRIEQFSEKIGISLNEYVINQDFRFQDMGEEKRKEVFEQGRKRQEVFETSKQQRKPKSLATTK